MSSHRFKMQGISPFQTSGNTLVGKSCWQCWVYSRGLKSIVSIAFAFATASRLLLIRCMESIQCLYARMPFITHTTYSNSFPNYEWKPYKTKTKVYGKTTLSESLTFAFATLEWHCNVSIYLILHINLYNALFFFFFLTILFYFILLLLLSFCFSFVLNQKEVCGFTILSTTSSYELERRTRFSAK